MFGPDDKIDFTLGRACIGSKFSTRRHARYSTLGKVRNNQLRRAETPRGGVSRDIGAVRKPSYRRPRDCELPEEGTARPPPEGADEP